MAISVMGFGAWIVLNKVASIWATAMWRICWQGTLLITFIYFVCRLFPKLPAYARYWLWWLACLKLCVGLLWATPIALPLLPASKQALTCVGVIQNPSSASHQLVSIKASAGFMMPSALSVLMLIWMAGLGLWTAILARQFFAARRLITQANPVECDKIARSLEAVQARLGLRHLPLVLTSDSIPNPLVIGPLRPTVLIPTGMAKHLSSRELDMVLTHELTHIKHGDLWWAQLPTLARILFFFHPLAWLAHHEWLASCEAACDAQTLQHSAATPAEYGHLLFKLIVRGRTPHSYVALGASSDYKMIESRINRLQHYNPILPPQLRWSALLLVLFGTLGIVPWYVTERTQAASTNNVNAESVTVSKNEDQTKLHAPLTSKTQRNGEFGAYYNNPIKIASYGNAPVRPSKSNRYYLEPHKANSIRHRNQSGKQEAPLTTVSDTIVSESPSRSYSNMPAASHRYGRAETADYFSKPRTAVLSAPLPSAKASYETATPAQPKTNAIKLPGYSEGNRYSAYSFSGKSPTAQPQFGSNTKTYNAYSSGIYSTEPQPQASSAYAPTPIRHDGYGIKSSQPSPEDKEKPPAIHGYSTSLPYSGVSPPER